MIRPASPRWLKPQKPRSLKPAICFSQRPSEWAVFFCIFVWSAVATNGRHRFSAFAKLRRDKTAVKQSGMALRFLPHSKIFLSQPVVSDMPFKIFNDADLNDVVRLFHQLQTFGAEVE